MAARTARSLPSNLYNTVGQGVKGFNEIPGPLNLPLVGTALEYRFGKFKKTEYHHAIRDMYKRYGPLVKENFGGKVILHVYDPKDIKTIYSNEGKYPVVPPLQETTQMYLKEKGMSLGLGNTNGDEWYNLRTNCIQKMLRPREVAHHLPVVDYTAQDLVRRIQEGKDSKNIMQNLRSEVGCWSIKNSINIVFERDLKTLNVGSKDRELAQKMVKASGDIFAISGDLKLSLPLYKYVYSPKLRKLVAAEDYFYNEAHKFMYDALSRFDEYVKQGGGDKFDLMGYLLAKPTLDVKDVSVICFNLLADSLTTTVPTLLCNLYSLARHKDLQDNVYQEVKQHLPEGTPATTERLASMQYIKAFVKENFRLYPSGTEVSRYTGKDMVLSGYFVPEGTYVDMNPMVHFMDESIFPDPEKHMPERWLRTSDKEMSARILTPFGHGARMCVGRRFAEQDLYVLISRILSRFELDLGPMASESTMGQVYNTLMFPDRPLQIRFNPRN